MKLFLRLLKMFDKNDDSNQGLTKSWSQISTDNKKLELQLKSLEKLESKLNASHKKY